ncbi:helix-turn-helix transcriptional regulator [Streptomyces sp. SID14478]|uniref:helix-turn-helix domain-containing protein n=1 Tax=Streptomyces sp. SID14478 TaxID=2706073 RepID=UPI0013DC3CBB|nr:helix-turn-helix transcriptional regulator [Streptomyces sp. SID14478]NEB75816.1 helix-turn-helix transcriptional regulator [Streptomyces sp. SID14478]
MSEAPNPLGDYVRARRALVTPEQAGIGSVGVRRVPGLRREEVATLAGISADYYLRLEQGRDRNPSVQVLESLARVLRLDEEATAYLLRLAAGPPRRPRRPGRESVPPSIGLLLATVRLPAWVEGRYFDVLAANAWATALSPRLVTGANRLRDLFLDPEEQALHPDRELAGGGMVAGFRASVGTETDDPRYRELVAELSRSSPLFRRQWARHDVDVCEGRPQEIDHPRVGRLRLNRERLGVSGAPGRTLVIAHPDPGTDSAEKLALLDPAGLLGHARRPGTEPPHNASPGALPDPTAGPAGPTSRRVTL